MGLARQVLEPDLVVRAVLALCAGVGLLAITGQQGEGADAAQLQLESLRLLLALLPPPGMGEEGLRAALIGEPGHAARVRSGLGLLLRGRVSAGVRHAALQLAAAVCELSGQQARGRPVAAPRAAGCRPLVPLAVALWRAGAAGAGGGGLLPPPAGNGAGGGDARAAPGRA